MENRMRDFFDDYGWWWDPYEESDTTTNAASHAAMGAADVGRELGAHVPLPMFPASSTLRTARR